MRVFARLRTPLLRWPLFAAFVALPAACAQDSSPLESSPIHRGSGDAAAPSENDAATVGPATGDAGAPAPGADAATDANAPPPDASVTPLGRLVVYASGYEPNIDLFPLDPSTGALSAPASTASFGTSPSFLAVNRAATHLYVVDENASGQVGAYAIDAATGALTFQNAVSSGGNGPPFVALDRSEAYALVANYGDGTVSVLPVKSDGSLSSPSQTLQVGANAHMILPDPSNRFVFVPCLGAGYVAQFLFDASTGHLSPNKVPTVSTASGAGPRHIAFHPNGKYVYLVNETNSTLSCYALDGSAGTLTLVQTVSTIPPGFSGTNTGAEVWAHPSGAWVLTSNRGADDIAVFPIDAPSGHIGTPTFTKSGGTTPRDLTIDATGTFVLAANQGTGNVVPFTFDAATGALTAVGTPMTLTNASFVGVVRLAAP